MTKDQRTALETLNHEAQSFGMMVSGLMPLDVMKSDYYKREFARFRDAVVNADSVLREDQ